MTKDEKINTLIHAACEGTLCRDCKVKDTCYTHHGISGEWTDEELDEALRLYVIEPGSAEETQGEVQDVVNHPQHYELPGGLECIDAMVATQGPEAVKAFCICNAFKYLWRHNFKKGAEDVEKARWYLNKWHDLQEEGVAK